MGKNNNSKKSSTESKKNVSTTEPELNNTHDTSVPDELKKVITDFIVDISNTFPEYCSTILNMYVIVSLVTDSETGIENKMLEIPDDRLLELYNHCKQVYPSRFFDILYKNEDIFSNKEETGKSVDDNDVNTMFLPTLDFKLLWNVPDVSDNTKEAIWKYLQLILFSIITNISDRNSFGDTAKLFEAINEDELKNKLQETFSNMNKLFDLSGNFDFENIKPEDFGIDLSGVNLSDFSQSEHFTQSDDSTNDSTDISKNTFRFPPGFESMFGKGANGGKNSSADIPNPEEVHEHLSKLLNGKIGSLAKELVEETAQDFDFNLNEEADGNVNVKNVFQKMFKNPGKLMNLVKTVGKKIDDKFKSGDIKESELLQEASDLLSKMKNMPGMNNLSGLFNQMGMGDMMGALGAMGGKGGKMNLGAMQSQLQQNMKHAKMKERMQSKLEQKKQQTLQTQQPLQSQTSTHHSSQNTTKQNVKPTSLQSELEQSKLMLQQLEQTEKQLMQNVIISDLDLDDIQNSVVSSNNANKSSGNKKKKGKK